MTTRPASAGRTGADVSDGPISRPYVIARARYAKGKIAVRCLDGDGETRGRASRLLRAVAPGARYSRRERATICTPAQVKRFVEAYRRGEDGVLGDRNGILTWVPETPFRPGRTGAGRRTETRDA